MKAWEHYGHAETLLDMASDEDSGSDHERYLIGAAHVHATLALAGATAMQAYVRGDARELADWEHAAGGEDE